MCHFLEPAASIMFRIEKDADLRVDGGVRIVNDACFKDAGIDRRLGVERSPTIMMMICLLHKYLRICMSFPCSFVYD